MANSSNDIGSNEINETVILSDENRLRLIGKVEVSGIGPVDALIDSGSDTCFVEENVLIDSIKSKIEPSNDTVAIFDGSYEKTLGYVYLRVSYLGKTVELPFVVQNSADDTDDCTPMVLGTTWIRRSGAILQSDGVKLGVTLGGTKENERCSAVQYNIPYVPVNVEGIRRVKALVDTGAPGCYIRRDLLTTLKKSKISVLNKTQLEKGECVSLNITFQGITTHIENVNVESKMANKLVLGMNWIHQTRAVIRSDGSKIIVFQPGLVHKPKGCNSLIAYLSKQWNSTIGSVSRISSLISNLM